MPARLTPYQSQYLAWQLTRRTAGDSVESIASTLVDAQVDLNPHQVDAALFACRNPLAQGVILADEVGLGKTIEAGLVIAQRWAERRRRILIIVPANLRKQWHQELHDKFGLRGTVLEAKNYNAWQKQGRQPLQAVPGPLICSYQFAKSKAKEIKALPWDLVILDEAHRLRNVYKNGNVIGKTLKDSLAHVQSKVLLTATPLQNSLLELYGLVSLIDDRVFGDLDSFRSQFALQAGESEFGELRERLAPICQRTLRKQVQPYVSYTKRTAIVQGFTPTDEEQRLAGLVREYLSRTDLHALSNSQRPLISLVLWKLLASSSQAIAGALDTMAKRLQGRLDDPQAAVYIDGMLDDDYEALADTAEDWTGLDEPNSVQAILDTADLGSDLAEEIAELQYFARLANQIRDNSKGAALLVALDKAFAQLDLLGAERKALIFTESKRTQDYLQRLLQDTPYGGDGLVLFNGSNSDARAQAIYKDWLKRHQGSDRITGSKTADTRAALVEYFKEQGKVMIATEAGAEGINLQFCSLVINYDLPWNPQRIEQRIGRCHRYGQKFDVVVVNFIDQSNPADQRVHELLAQKFQLFNGVFGASDEVLGAIGSGVDFERRIVDILQKCRGPEAIEASFEQLQRDLSGEIDQTMLTARQRIFDHFDEAVQEKLRIRDSDSKSVRSRYEQMLLDLAKAELEPYAQFSDGGFQLQQIPPGLDAAVGEVELGAYEVPSRSGNAHLYRVQHPLALWVAEQAKARTLDSARLVFYYDAYASKLSSLEAYRGQSGWLSLSLLEVEALDQIEQHLLVSAVTIDGKILPEDDPEKLLRLPASPHPLSQPNTPAIGLIDDVDARKRQLLRDINQRNMGYFEQEVQKLDAWADDLKLGLEQQIKEIDREIKEVRRTAATAPMLEEKLGWQKHQRELESKRSKLRRELFSRQDEIEAERNELIEKLESQLQQRVQEQPLFSIEWTLL